MENIILDPDIKIKAAKKSVTLNRKSKLISEWHVSGEENNDLVTLLKELKTNGIGLKDFRKLPVSARGFLDGLISRKAMVYSDMTKKKKTFVTLSCLSGKKPKHKSATLVLTEDEGSVSITSPFSGKDLHLKGKIQDLFVKEMRKEIKDSLHSFRKISPEDSTYHMMMDSLLPLLSKRAFKKSSGRENKKASVLFPKKKDKIKDLVKTFSTESIRNFSGKKISYQDLSSLVQIADSGRRPSAGAIYETQIFISVHQVEGLNEGFYEVTRDGLIHHKIPQDILDGLSSHARFSMKAGSNPHAVIWFVPDFKMTNEVYQNISIPLALLNAGVLLDRFYLAAKALGIGGCAVGRGNHSLILQEIKVLKHNQFITCGFAI